MTRKQTHNNIGSVVKWQLFCCQSKNYVIGNPFVSLHIDVKKKKKMKRKSPGIVHKSCLLLTMQQGQAGFYMKAL